MSEEQFTLFADDLTDDFKEKRYLNIVKDGIPCDMTIDELFNKDQFTKIKAVSFVASPKFFFKVTEGFKESTLILGIEDGLVAGSFINGLKDLLDIESRLKTIQGLSKTTQEKLLEATYEIRYSKKNEPIHSKIFLLEGESETRVMIGSANFTETAFSTRKQYEELYLFDNSPLYPVYLERFDDIYKETADFLPEKFKKKEKDEVINVIDSEVLTEMLIDEIKNGKIVADFSEEQMGLIKDVKNTLKKESDDLIRVDQLVNIITKKERKTGSHKVLPIVQIEKKKASIKSSITRTNKNTQKVDVREFVEYNHKNHLLYKKVKNEITDEMYIFSKEIEEIKYKEKVREQLLLIGEFIEAYERFSINQASIAVQSRIFEAILYSFTASYIWKIRDDLVLAEERESIRRHIPLFLLLAGRGSSGKTSAIEFINLLMGNDVKYLRYEDFNSPGVIEDMFYTSNLNPILMDEVDISFFKGKEAKNGERFIKEITNNLKGKHPTLVGTTNTQNFDLPIQIISRIYYLQIDNTFEEKTLSESSEYLKAISNKIDSSLYKDFTFKLAELIKYSETFYSVDDFLLGTREIFKQYYKDADLPIPKWFPNEPFKDYRNRGATIWRELFISNKHSFDIRKDNTMFVRVEELTRGTNKVKNFLPPEVIIEDSTVLILNHEQFMKFIQKKDETKSGFWKRLLTK